MIWLIPLAFLAAGDWSGPVEVRWEENLCLSYRARIDGSYLVVEARVEPGWHTFAMDNERRAKEKLAGKTSLGIDRATEIAAARGLTVAGPWYQTQPKDFSKPELRWFSWGFENQALFVTRVRRGGAAQARVRVRGQACSDTKCKNIDVEIPVPVPAAPGASEVNLKDLVPVR
ncbi:MAG: hypothetical protein ACRD96_29410 [Bryobacteraceae bacterium]